ncbi:hypothetical protein XENOCAPTIV_023337 [Xenoophorus captivus]|uniref:Uncharacterized protein n=1 Tax=Xenoophorus captivus TaxID=1517983 RepID=A0ABV0SC23_9TELE
MHSPHCMCVCVCFPHTPMGEIQRVFADGVIETAAQTAEFYPCGVPLTQHYKDHIVHTEEQERIFIKLHCVTIYQSLFNNCPDTQSFIPHGCMSLKAHETGEQTY